MRRYLPMILTFVALIAVFWFTMRQQPAMPAYNGPSSVPSTEVVVATKNSPNLTDKGDKGWFVQYDLTTGRRSYQFKYQQYDNGPNGVIHVTAPIIEFFPDDGRVIHIVGDEGDIRTNPGQDRLALNGAPTVPPQSGTLRNVIIKTYASESQLEATPNNPDMTITIANAEFDNDIFTLSTKEYTDSDGKLIPRDQVPVTLHAPDYDFDGQGMILNWNDADKRLKALEITHGHQLTIHRPGQGGAIPGMSAMPARRNSITDWHVASLPEAKVVLVSDVTPAVPITSQPSAGQRYRASFHDDVRVLQNGSEMARGTEMDVEFLMAPDKRQTNPAPTVQPSPSASASPQSSSPSTTPVSAPANAPSEKPLQILWTGKMDLVPDTQPSGPLDLGQSNLTLKGSPAVLSEPGKNGNGAQVFGDEIEFSTRNNFGLVNGPGKAVFPDPNAKGEPPSATWEKKCVLHFDPSLKVGLRIQDADLMGNVSLQHPALSLTAGEVQFQFDPVTKAATQPSLSEIIATGDANCRMIDADQSQRQITAQRLDLRTAKDSNGKLFAKTANADGRVVVIADDQQMRGEHLTANFKAPVAAETTPAPSAADAKTGTNLESLRLSENVEIAGADGSSATGDVLTFDAAGDQPVITLLGKPGIPATFNGNDSTLSGNQIEIFPKLSQARFDGPGQMNFVSQSDDKDQPGQPVQVSWKDSAVLAGDEVTITKDVVVENGGAAQTRPSTQPYRVGKGDRLVIELVPRESSTRPSDSITHAAGTLSAQDFDFLQRRQVKSFSLQDSKQAVLQSTENGPDGKPVNQYTLAGPRIDFDSKQVRVDQSGKMVMLKNAPENQKPVASNTTSPFGDGLTGIIWGDHFVYDISSKSATMRGRVNIKYNIGEKSEASLDADMVKADFAAPVSATQPSNSDLADNALQKLNADGSVVIHIQGRIIKCDHLVYDPRTQRMTFSADPNKYCDVFNETTRIPEGQFSHVVLNLQNNTLEEMTDFNARNRGTGSPTRRPN